jgi:hypothetical protein
VWFMHIVKQVQDYLKGIVWFVSYGASSEPAQGVCVVHAYCKASSELAQGVCVVHARCKPSSELAQKDCVVCELWSKFRISLRSLCGVSLKQIIILNAWSIKNHVIT